MIFWDTSRNVCRTPLPVCNSTSYILHLNLYFAIVLYSIFSIIFNWESMMTNCYHLNKMMMNDYCSPMQVAPFTLPSASLNPWKRKTTASNSAIFSPFCELVLLQTQKKHCWIINLLCTLSQTKMICRSFLILFTYGL